MATMTVSLPERMKEWVEAQIAAGEFASTSDYVRDLIRRDRERKAGLEALGRLIDEAEASGLSTRTVEEIFADARARAEGRGLRRG